MIEIIMILRSILGLTVVFKLKSPEGGGGGGGEWWSWWGKCGVCGGERMLCCLVSGKIQSILSGKTERKLTKIGAFLSSKVEPGEAFRISTRRRCVVRETKGKLQLILGTKVKIETWERDLMLKYMCFFCFCFFFKRSYVLKQKRAKAGDP